jgi:pilus assembly protein CpaB
MNKRLAGLLIAAVLALVGTVLLVAYVKKAEDRALEGETFVEVLVVTGGIPSGTPASELEALTALEEIPERLRPDDALTVLTDVEGLVTATVLFDGETLLLGRFVEPDAFTSTAVEVPEGLLEVTIALSPERAVGGALVPGDTVAVIQSYEPFGYSPGTPPAELPEEERAEIARLLVQETVLGSLYPGGETPSTTHLILSKVLVTNVQIDVNNSTSTPDEDAPETGRSEAPTSNLLVTLALEPNEVERVVFAAEFGNTWLARQDASAATGPTQIETYPEVLR